MPDVGGIAGDQLKSFVERIERLHEERKALADDIAEVFKEAKGTGFDTKIMRIVIRHRAMDKDDLDEQETLVDVYKRALGMLPPEPGDDAPSRVHAHEAAASESHKRVDRLVDEFVDSVPEGTSASITVNGKGVRITNNGGKRTVERVGAEA